MREFKKAQSATWTAVDWAEEMSRLRSVKPRPLLKLYGRNPTDEQKREHKAEEGSWNAAYRHASSMQKKRLKEENEAWQKMGESERAEMLRRRYG